MCATLTKKICISYLCRFSISVNLCRCTRASFLIIYSSPRSSKHDSFHRAAFERPWWSEVSLARTQTAKSSHTFFFLTISLSLLRSTSLYFSHPLRCGHRAPNTCTWTLAHTQICTAGSLQTTTRKTGSDQLKKKIKKKTVFTSSLCIYRRHWTQWPVCQLHQYMLCLFVTTLYAPLWFITRSSTKNAC